MNAGSNSLDSNGWGSEEDRAIIVREVFRLGGDKYGIIFIDKTSANEADE